MEFTRPMFYFTNHGDYNNCDYKDYEFELPMKKEDIINKWEDMLYNPINKDSGDESIFLDEVNTSLFSSDLIGLNELISFNELIQKKDEDIISYLENCNKGDYENIKAFSFLDICSNNGVYTEIYDCDSEIIEMYVEQANNDPFRLKYMCQNLNTYDDFICINAYGNLESYSSYDVINEIRENVKDIILEKIKENID